MHRKWTLFQRVSKLLESLKMASLKHQLDEISYLLKKSQEGYTIATLRTLSKNNRVNITNQNRNLCNQYNIHMYLRR